jgi:hypothetical protein
MPAITFDGPNKTITIGYDGPITSVTAEQIYSRWKEWVKLDNAQYEPAFGESVGGNELGGGTALAGYYFINNNLGWNITHTENDYEIRITGDIYPTDPNASFIIPTVNPYSVTFGQAGDPATIAAAVWDKQMADHTVTGSFGKRVKELLPTLWGIK